MTVSSEVEPDPTIGIIMKGIEQLRASGATAVLAVGGGSPIDAAKAMIACHASGRRPQDLDGYFKVRGPVLQFFAVPTTAGSGSEVTVALEPVVNRKAAADRRVDRPNTRKASKGGVISSCLLASHRNGQMSCAASRLHPHRLTRRSSTAGLGALPPARLSGSLTLHMHFVQGIFHDPADPMSCAFDDTGRVCRGQVQRHGREGVIAHAGGPMFRQCR